MPSIATSRSSGRPIFFTVAPAARIASMISGSLLSVRCTSYFDMTVPNRLKRREGCVDFAEVHRGVGDTMPVLGVDLLDRKSTRLNSSHLGISYAVFCLKKQRRQI